MLLLCCYFLAVSHSLVYSEQFDVLKVSDVPFPSTVGRDKGVASINGTYNEPISDYTICYRFLVEFYNDGIFTPFGAAFDSSLGRARVLDHFGGMGTGWESEGLQGGLVIDIRNGPNGGLGGKNLPWYHNYVFPKDLDISKWYHNCISYSNSLNHIHYYTDGMKTFSFHYQVESGPWPANAFEYTGFGQNFRGLFTDFQVHSKYFDKEEMIRTTTSCDEKRGDIISWDKNKVKIKKEFDIFMENLAKIHLNSNICQTSIFN